MSDIQLLTIVITLLAIFAAMYGNRKSVEDMRNVLRAETKVQSTELRAAVQGQFADVGTILARIENKLDHVVATQASHSEWLQRLEDRAR